MKVWSQGLGRTELVFDFKECVRNGEEVCLMGETTKPTKWQLKVTVSENDTPALIKVALSKKMISLVVRYYLKRIGKILRIRKEDLPE